MLGLAGCDLPGAGSEGGVLPASSSAADGVHASSSIAEVASSSAASSHAVDASVAADVRAAVEGIVAEYGEGVSVTFLPVGSMDGLVSINGAVQHSSASMIKLLVLAALLDAAQQGTVDLSADVEVAPEDIVGGSGTVQDDGAGTYALQELARRMIADSDNTATNVIVDLIGMDAVNAEATKLGLSNTVMARKMMDTTAAEQGMQNRMSSDDAATILNLIASGRLVNEQMSELALGFLLQQSVNAGLVDGVPAGVDVAHKTGELVQVEHDGGIVLAAQPYVLVVMTEGMDNAAGVSLIAQVSRAAYVATNGTEGVPEQSDVAAAALAAAGAGEGPTGSYVGSYDEPDVAFVGYDGSDYSGGEWWGEDDGYADDGGYDDAGGYDDGTGDGGADVPVADTPTPAPDAGNAGGAGTDSGGAGAGAGTGSDAGGGAGGGAAAGTGEAAGGTDAGGTGTGAGAPTGGDAGGAAAAAPDNDVAA